MKDEDAVEKRVKVRQVPAQLAHHLDYRRGCCGNNHYRGGGGEEEEGMTKEGDENLRLVITV